MIRQELQGDVASEPGVFGLIDDSHSAATQPFSHAIVKYCFADHVSSKELLTNFRHQRNKSFSKLSARYWSGEEQMRYFSSRLLLGLIVVTGTVGPLWSQTPKDSDVSFEVATIKPTPPDDRSGRFMRMQSTRQLVVKSYSLKYLVAAAYDIPPRAISGGPEWIDVDLYDILALTPGDTKPGFDAQLAMLRRLLTDRFSLKFHREPKEF